MLRSPGLGNFFTSLFVFWQISFAVCCSTRLTCGAIAQDAWIRRLLVQGWISAAKMRSPVRVTTPYTKGTRHQKLSMRDGCPPSLFLFLKSCVYPWTFDQGQAPGRVDRGCDQADANRHGTLRMAKRTGDRSVKPPLGWRTSGDRVVQQATHRISIGCGLRRFARLVPAVAPVSRRQSKPKRRYTKEITVDSVWCYCLNSYKILTIFWLTLTQHRTIIKQTVNL